MTKVRAFSGSEKNDRGRAGRGPQILRLGVALAVALATAASAQTYTVLKSFNGSDGMWPHGGVVLSGSALYGTARSGGSSGYGVVFKVNTDGSGYTVLKSFTGSDGYESFAGLTLADNTLYGTTYYGGSSFVLPGQPGDGVVFKVNTDGSGYTVLKKLTWPEGANPYGCVAVAGSTLYGTTQSGGGSGGGVVFKVNTDGSGYTVLNNLNWPEGAHPSGGLNLAGSTLYGTAQSGGSGGNGVVFKMNTDGSGYTALKKFTGSDGSGPFTDLALAGNTLYGTTQSGGSSGHGVVFRMNTDGSGYTVLKSFTGSDGAGPQAGVVLAGSTLYGTTPSGGSANYGVVFSVTMLPPSIIRPPLTQTAEIGTTPWFSVKVTNTLPELTHYQWFFSGTKALGSATNSYLALANVQPFQVGAYTVVVTNLSGAVTSAPALLSVIPPVERRIVTAVHLPSGTGDLLHLEYADNLAAAPAWSSFTNVTLGSRPQLCFDLSQPLPEQRFYRAWQTNGPQPALDLSLATEIPLAGTIGRSVRVDYINAIGPTDAWVTLDTVTLTNSPQLYFDVTAFRQPTRLYRLIAVP